MNDEMGRETGMQTRDEGVRERAPLFGVGLAILFAAAAFFSGMEVSSMTRHEASLGFLLNPGSRHEDVNLKQFWEVWDLLDDKFVSSTTTEGLGNEEKMHGAIAGLVDSYGDPYTVFMPPVEAEMFAEDIRGNFEGVGMEVGVRNDIITVIAPLPESPAQKAGIQSGDAIIKIDGESTEGLSVDEAVKRIRGEGGTTVNLTLYREGETEFLEIAVVRDTITIPTMTTEEKDGVFIIRLFNFSAVSEAKMQEALREFIRSGDRKLVLDLRGNPGGYLQSAVAIASYFLPTGKVVVRENFGPDTTEEVHRSLGRDITAGRPIDMVVLVDGGSASASEILAGALQEHGVARLIGTKTFGKGSVQELIDLDDGSSVKITIARWLTPNGVSISDGGLTPDEEVIFTPEDREAQKDPQLDAALEYLKNK